MSKDYGERFTAQMWAIVNCEGQGSIADAIVAILPGEDRCRAELERRKALEPDDDGYIDDFHVALQIALDARIWNSFDPEIGTSPYCYPSEALDAIAKRVGLEDAFRGESGEFDPALVDARQEAAQIGLQRMIEAWKSATGFACPQDVIDARDDKLRRALLAAADKKHAFGCPVWYYDPCECDFARRSGLDRPAVQQYHAGFRDGNEYAWVAAATFEFAHAAIWNGYAWGCAR